jgi:hypothetical protein
MESPRGREQCERRRRRRKKKNKKEEKEQEGRRTRKIDRCARRLSACW